MPLLLWLLALLLPVQGERPATGDDLAALRAELEASSTGEEAAKVVAAVLDAAAKARETRDQHLAQVASLKGEADTIPPMLAGVQRDLADTGFPAADPPPEGASLDDLKKGLATASANASTARDEATRLEQRFAAGNNRRKALPEELAAAHQALERAEQAVPDPLPAADAPLPDRARALQLVAEREEAAAHVRALEAEQSLLEARAPLTPLQIQRERRRATAWDAAQTAWQGAVDALNQSEAAEALRQAMEQRRKTERQYPLLGTIAQRNEELAKRRSGDEAGDEGISARLKRTREKYDEESELLKNVQRRFESTRNRVAVAGLSNLLGAVLQRELERLPDTAGLRRDASVVRAQLIQDELFAIELEEDKAEADSFEDRKAELLGSGAGAEVTFPPEAEQLFQELVTARKTLVSGLLEEVGQLKEKELQRSGQLEALATVTEQFEAFIAERILWVRSEKGGSLPSSKELGALTRWFFAPEPWLRAWRQGLHEVSRRPLAPLGLAVGALFAFATRRRAVRALHHTAEAVRSYRTDGFSRTIEALIATLVLSVPGALLMLLAGWILLAPGNQPSVAQPSVALATGEALRRSARVLFGLELLRQINRSRGLAEAHLRWPGAAARHVRRQLYWYTPLAVLLVFAVRVLANQDALEHGSILVRWVLALSLVALAAFTALAFRPHSPVFQDLFRRASETLLQRSSWAWFGIAFVAPLAIAAMGTLGYATGALALSHFLANTYLLVLAVAVGYGLLLRWLRYERRRILVEQARLRARARAEEEGSDAPVSFDEDAVDVAAIDAQTRRLFRTLALGTLAVGMYLIWSSALPALQILNRVHVWPELRIVAEEDAAASGKALVAGAAIGGGSGSNANGATGSASHGSGSGASTGNGASAPAPSNGRPSLPVPGAASDEAQRLPAVVTLGNVLGALVILILMGIGARNLPGLLEILLLKRLPLDAGSRYAIGALVRYAIVIVGTTVALGTIGISWSSVQWLAAALTFGLGFGLQEIFANFVSGLIILLERPVRVGDVVTVSGVEGYVTQIRMRSTTILDWDRRELLVPNREFITNSLINWTLTDTITRLVLPVGVAYGSDTRRARGLLLRCARESELVLDEPKPTAIFREFADSALTFQLRVFIRHRDVLPDALDDLHQRIDDAFRAADIEIAFPQRDLHIRSADPLVEAMRVRAEPVAPAAKTAKETDADEDEGDDESTRDPKPGAT